MSYGMNSGNDSKNVVAANDVVDYRSFWAGSRIIMHIDMNAFFASVEQQNNPELRGKPIAVIGSAKRTVITTSSYEARAYGVKTGMDTWQAKQVCPHILFVIGDNKKCTCPVKAEQITGVCFPLISI